MRPDRKWMYKRWDGKCLSEDFIIGVEEFIEFAKREDSYIHDAKLRCPCSNCKNRKFQDVDSIREHLYRRGFRNNYYEWVCHGESFSDLMPLTSTSNPYRDMVIDVLGPTYGDFGGESEDFEEDPHPDVRKLLDMLKDAEKPLYEGCNMSILEMASKIINLKSEYNLAHRCVDGFAALMSDSFPDRSLMTRSFHDTRRVLEGLELPHEKIHTFVNECMLFWRQNAHLDKCLKCEKDRYKMTSMGKLIPAKVLIYFPITPRLQRLYATEYMAKQMRWHAEHHRVDGVMSHPSDGEAWMSLDRTYPGFASDSRNVRLGLCTDGFAPFGKSGSNYSCWPVIVTPYNLPPWLCMKHQFMFITLIIPGPKSPKGNLDVFLQPVIDEMKGLWEFGALTYDMCRKQNFLMRAVLLWTISDFPAYGMLSGWSTSGKLACPYCMTNSKSFWLKHGGKVSWFDCHRQFLFEGHPFRRNKSSIEHLPIHLPFEASVGGPIHYRWMYRCERKTHNLKQKIGNKARVEGSICNAYLTEEISNFYAHYFEPHVDTKSRDSGRNIGLASDVPQDPDIPELFRVNLGCATSKGKLIFILDDDYKRAHLYVVSNCELLKEYEREFVQHIMYHHPNVEQTNIWPLFEQQYPEWLEEFVQHYGAKSDVIRTLAMDPSSQVRSWRNYFINGYNFHTYDYGRHKGTMNYGVCVNSQDGVDYFGILLEVIELVYHGLQAYKTVLFKCDWYDPVNGVNVHP